MTITAAPTLTAPGPPGGPAVRTPPRMTHVYFDASGARKTSRILVPVDECGELAGKAWACRKCTGPTWKPLNFKGVPVCPVHQVKMTPLPLRAAPLLPYRELWAVCERPLRPVWALPGMAALGCAVDAAHIPAVAVAGAAPLAFEAARRGWRRHRLAWHVGQGNLDPGDPEHGKRLRAAVDAAARKVGYCAALGASWLSAAAGLGLDPSTLAGKVVWSALLPVWALPAATWWVKQRRTPKPRPAAPTLDALRPETDEERVLRLWATGPGVRAGDIIGAASDGTTPVKAQQPGKLAGTRLEGWHRIRGGWAATIVGPPGVYEADNFLSARGKIASSYSVTRAMVSLVPDGEDENRCGLFVQKTAVINEAVPWAGPDSIDVEKGVAPLVRYLDGSLGMYELYRPGWGCAHELYIGTTGAAKSSAMELVFTIDRWAHYTDPDGVKRGIIADFLIDPQQGQSFGAHLDDLAAPVASTIDEAMMLVRAFRREMLRRNKYLARKRWTDERGLPRRGAKWWNPLEDGPILVLNIDEAHEFLAVREFAALVTAGSRMYRKCGMRVRIATHTPLLSDLGGSMALRDMLTGGFVWCGRTANGLSGPTAFNGRLPADPKFIPEVPGAAYILSALEKKPMLARTMWEPDFYRYIRDDNNEPIGYPAVLPAETLQAFGAEYADWLRACESDDDDDGQPWAPSEQDRQPLQVERSDDFLVDVVQSVLVGADGPLDMDGLDAALRGAEIDASTLAVRTALGVLRSRGEAVTVDGRHELHPKVRAEMLRQIAEQQNALDAADSDAVAEGDEVQR
jgi:hypothetical protein